MQARVMGWYQANAALLSNAVALVGTTGVNAVCGMLYWWVAARFYATREVGIASASISAMMLLGTAAMLGLGTLLVGQLSQPNARRGELISTALMTAFGTGVLLGGGFALAAPWLADDLAVLGSGVGPILLFALGVGMTALTLVLDQVLIGLLWGGVQFARNAAFAVGKLAVLALVAWLLATNTSLSIYATWIVGNALSIGLVGLVALARGAYRQALRPRLVTLRGMLGGGLRHHVLNLALQAPGLILPVLVTVVVSAEAAGRFYIAWMLASYVFVVPFALAMVLFAVGSADRALLREKLRLSFGLSCAIGLVACGTLALAAEPLLRVFGASYAADATDILRLLGLAVVAIAIKDHYVAIHRVEGRVTAATLPVLLGALCEIAVPAFGGLLVGLPGVAIGWLIGLYVQTLWMAPLVVRTARQPAIPATVPDALGS